MKKNLILLFFVTFLELVQSETTLIIDRRSFIQKPTRACAVVISNKELIDTSCTSFGYMLDFNDSRDLKRTDYIFFNQFSKSHPDLTEKESFISVVYFSGSKVMGLTPFNEIREENMISIDNIDYDHLISHVMELESEVANLKNVFNEAENNLKSNVKSSEDNSEAQEKIRQINLVKSKFLRHEYIDKEINFIKQKNDLTRKNLTKNPQSKIKPLLSKLLKNSIENDLRTKN